MNVINYSRDILEEFYLSTVKYRDRFNQLNVLDTYKKYYNELLNNLDAYIQYLDVHRKYLSENAKLSTIDVYQCMNSFFTRNQHSKGKYISYSIQQGLIGKAEHIKPSDPRLSCDFKINNALPIMSIVLFQIADNALKYMPTNTTLEIELRTTEDQCRFRFINIGPSLKLEELNQLMEFNIRGQNASLSKSGEGIGLYLANQIVKLHKWINASLSIDSKDAISSDTGKQLKIDEKPQSVFIVTLQFDRHITGNFTNNDDHEWINRDFTVVLIHNLYQVISHLIDLYARIDTIQVKDPDYSWREINNYYRTYLNLFLDKINLCNLLYRGFDNQFAVDQVSRINEKNVPMRVQKIFHHMLNNINQIKNKQFEINENGNLSNRSFSSGLWTFAAGFIDLLFEVIPNSCSELFIEYLTTDDNTGFYVTFDLNDTEAQKLLNNIVNDKFKESRLKMYELMIEKWNGEIKFEKYSVSVYLPYQEAI